MFKFMMGTLSVMAIVYLVGCAGSNSLLVTQADFDKLTDGIFNPADFTRSGGGLSGSGDTIELSAVYEPRDPTATIHFDFGTWDSFLKARDRFTGHGKGGSQGMYWRQSWDNKNRFIVIDAVVMKDQNIRITYREILR